MDGPQYLVDRNTVLGPSELPPTVELPRYTEADFRIGADTAQRRARAARWTPTPQLAPALTRPIRWELIAQQYDQMIKYATAIRTRSTPQAARS